MKLVHYEVADDAYTASAREKEIKGWTRDKKLALIRSANAAMRDLVPDLVRLEGGAVLGHEAVFPVARLS